VFDWLLTTEVEGRECDPGSDAEVVFNEVGGGNRQVKVAYVGDTGVILLNGRLPDAREVSGDDLGSILEMTDYVLASPTGAVLFKTDSTAEYIGRTR
jgi:hypothetical protein